MYYYCIRSILYDDNTKPMKNIFALIFLFLCFCFSNGYAQEKKYDISAPTNLPQTGVNKVLCMKNGNTMLFHFEPAKKINVIVFDSLHKEIANSKEGCHILDILTLEHVMFKGLFDINNEAVLFFDQDHNGRHSLVRLRYNASSGALIEEKLVAESKNENNRMKFYVMKNKEEDNYSILFCTDKYLTKDCDIFLAFFNNQHTSIKEIQLQVDRKKFDYLDVIGAEWQPNGTFITLSLAKTQVYGQATLYNPDNPMSSVYDHYLQYFYIPKGSATPRTRILSLSTEVTPRYTFYTHNPFANALNLLVFNYKPIDTTFGLHKVSGAKRSSLFYKFDEFDLSAGLNNIKDAMANDFYRQNTDPNKLFIGEPLTMFTDDNGLTTIVSQSFTRYGEQESWSRYNYEDYYGNICITQVDDNGNELWGTMLPLSQYYKSYEHYFPVLGIPQRWQSQVLFGDMPPQVYNRQFMGINLYRVGKSSYMIYNDYDKNFNNTLKNPGDTVYSFNTTDACYYKLNNKREVTKGYVFGDDNTKDHKCSFIEGAGFDEKRGIYASLIQYKKGDEISLRVAWSKLD